MCLWNPQMEKVGFSTLPEKREIIKLALQVWKNTKFAWKTLKNYTPCCHTSQVIPQVQSDRRKWQWESKPFRLPLSFQTSNVFVSCFLNLSQITNFRPSHPMSSPCGLEITTGGAAMVTLVWLVEGLRHNFPNELQSTGGAVWTAGSTSLGRELDPSFMVFFRWLENLFWEVILLEVLIGIWSWKGNGGSHLWPSLGVSEIPTAVQIFMSGVGSLRTQSTQNTWWPWW